MTTSLELSKQLWERGLRIETEKHREWDGTLTEYPFTGGVMNTPSPSTDELLAVMPENIQGGRDYHLEILKVDNYLVVGYRNFYTDIIRGEGAPCIVTTFDKSLPEALGKMILWLLNNGYKYEEKEKCLNRINV